MNRQITVGMLAHVDAGKTTLTEGLLYLSGAIRKQGRVDHRDTFLDTDPVERERGITVYAKQARLTAGDTDFTLLDTPGHADLSPEMERTLWVLDYAILLISAQDGVTTQVRLLWKLLEANRVPVFLFVNKMDRPGADKEVLLEEIRRDLKGTGSFVDFSEPESEAFWEAVALTEEALLEKYLEGELPKEEEVIRLIRERKLVPVWFGTALKNEGVAELLAGMQRYMRPAAESHNKKDIKSGTDRTEKSYGSVKTEKEKEKSYGSGGTETEKEKPHGSDGTGKSETRGTEEFAARIFKVSRDNKGARLVWLKVTGGTLSVKQNIVYEKGEARLEEKIDQIRLYSGSGFELLQSAPAGTVVAVTGLTKIGAGDVLGEEMALTSRVIEPPLTYEIGFEPPLQTAVVWEALRRLEEEEPQLHVRLSEKTGKISVRVMGQVQMEILKRQMKERFDMDLTFGAQTICYKETISRVTEGVGHFEPLRHYAEVRLLLEPLPAGSGVQFENLCPVEELEPHWQRLIMSHLNERQHTGVLTDSELTDLRISLLGGRAHTKHTESGDFRQATFRAIRQGLMENGNVLLEPCFDFVLQVPEGSLGRALFDLNQMGAVNNPPEIENGMCVISGSGPAEQLGSYQEQVTVYTGGEGRLFCSFQGYVPCHNAEEVIEKIGYDPERDVDNPSASVFCSHGAGIIVPWYQVKERMHTQSSGIGEETMESEGQDPAAAVEVPALKKAAQADESSLSFKERGARMEAAEKELSEIFLKTYGSKGEPAARPGWKTARRQTELLAASRPKKKAGKTYENEYLLVDGYNIIFAWPELKKMAEADIGAARDTLMDILSDFHGMNAGTLILVFDAYKVAGGREAVSRYHNIYVVYTKESETADQYIEKTVYDLGKNNRVTVATSDGLEQMIILGEGAVRMSAAGLLEAVRENRKMMDENWLGGPGRATASGRSYLLDEVSDEVRSALEDLKE